MSCCKPRCHHSIRPVRDSTWSWLWLRCKKLTIAPPGLAMEFHTAWGSGAAFRARHAMYTTNPQALVARAAIRARREKSNTRKAPTTKPARAARVLHASIDATPKTKSRIFHERLNLQPGSGRRRLIATTARIAPDAPIAFALWIGKTPTSLSGYMLWRASSGHKTAPNQVQRSSTPHRINVQLKNVS